MWSRSSLSLCTIASIIFLRGTAALNLKGRSPVRSDITGETSSAQATAFATVPSFSAPSFTYGAFSQQYPSGYTLPSGPFITTTASSPVTATASSSTGGQDRYLMSMCAPQSSQDSNTNALDQRFPCNRVSNSSYACIYNATLQDVNEGARLQEVSPQAQRDCLCPGGKGNGIWEDVEGCDECLRLHGATPLNSSSNNEYNFIPTGFVQDLSSAYCAQATASRNWADFANDFSVTHPVSYGTVTGGTDLLQNKTAVSNYFTETSGNTQAATTATASSQAESTSRSPRATAPVSVPSSSSTTPAAASSTGGANSLGRSALLSTGLLGVLWLLLQTPSRIRHRALLPQGSKAFTVTTSSHKKRRLSPPEIRESVHSTQGTTTNDLDSPPSQQSLPLSSPPHISLPDQSPITSSPPRYIPPHLVLEGARKGRSPTPEVSTAASSPSAAYASLTLDTEGSGDVPSGENRTVNCRRSSLTNKEHNSGRRLSNRSASPATKRPAADMEGNLDGTADRREPAKEGVSRRKSQAKYNRHQRELSVDMLDEEPEALMIQGTLPTVPESGGKSLLNGAYQTPGTSTSGSSSREQESSDMSPASSSTSPQIPSVDEQIVKVGQLAETPLVEGQKGFIVSNMWLGRVLARSSDAEEAKKYPKEAAEGDIGPVDNSGLNLVLDPTLNDLKDEKGDPYIPLRPGLAIREDFEIIPQEAWDLIISWYGLAPASAAITRYCHNTTNSETAENLQFEIYPPIFTILKLPDLSEGITSKSLADRSSRPVKVLASRHETFQTFLARAKRLANIDIKVKVRIWKIFGGLGDGALDGMLTPAQSRSNSPAPGATPVVDPGQSLVLDAASFTNLDLGSQRELVDVKDETANEKYNGRSTMDLVGLRRDEIVVVEEQRQGPGGGEFVSDGIQSTGSGVPISFTKSGSTIVKGNLRPKANTASGRTSPAPPGGMMTRGRMQKNGRTRGTVGLANLGNTCYMNSALQCLRSVPELAPYFLNGHYKTDLNTANVLGHKGVLAKAYAALLSEFYSEQSNKSSFTPRAFKNVAGSCSSLFSGYGQQDSQEFLNWLLGGLEEDLNRVHEKPYIEKPDSTDEHVHNPTKLRELADECWKIYKARNDSVISDLFAGVYKSTVACPVCDKVSIIFDPFSTFTLQLPIKNYWVHDVYYFPLHKRPILVPVDIDQNSTLMALKEYIGKEFSRDPKKMMIAEIYKNKFFKLFTDEKSIAEERIQPNDLIAVYELEEKPTNWPAQKKSVQKKALTFHKNDQDEEDTLDSNSPVFDQILVGLFHRRPALHSVRPTAKEIFGVPSFIVVSREEAKDYEAILRKVLENVQSMTTKNILGTAEDTEAEDSDTVLMKHEEAENSDSKVQTQSVEGEDGIIDVSMRDAGEDTQESPPEANSAKWTGGGRGISIKPELRTLFDMKIFTADGGETIPSGWGTLQDESKQFPSLTDRLSKRASGKGQKRSTRDQITRHLARKDATSSSEDEALVSPGPVPTHGSDSDSNDGLPPVEQLTAHPAGHSRFSTRTHVTKRKLITYSRKGKRSSISEPDEPHTLNAPLLKHGEAIILDWDENAYDDLFGGISGDDKQGSATEHDVSTHVNPELSERKKKRENVRRYGITLDDCLDEFVRPETLSENDAWYCPRCKAHRRATKTFELWKCPDILVIHLKRFSSGPTRSRDKLDIMVDFPVEGLDMTTRVALHEEDRSAIYDLFAVDDHYGGLGGGHYTAYAKNYFDERWYEYNDTQVHQTNPKKVVTPAAYLLFYRRRSSTALGGPFFEQLLSNESDKTEGSQPGSRTASPSGEGRRLDDSSRNGSSSAFLAAEAVHQAGGGGSTRTTQRTGVDDELPTYSAPRYTPEDMLAGSVQELEQEDETEWKDGREVLIKGHQNPQLFLGPHTLEEPSWSFGKTEFEKTDDGRGRAPEYQANFEDGWDTTIPRRQRPSSCSSMEAAPPSPSIHSDGEQGMNFIDSLEDPGTTSGFAGDAITANDIDPMLDDEVNQPVTEIKIPDYDGDYKME